jgi:gliding motility-associated-like protein
MKRSFQAIVGTLLLICSTSGITYAQISGGSVFLQGCFIELAISDCGVYGTSVTPPDGPFGDYHEINFNGLGFVADHEKDGWDDATGPGEPVFCGDYFAPGSPEEGWAIQVGSDIWENHAIGCQGYGFGFGPDIDGSVTGYFELSGGIKQAVWEGEISDGDVNLNIVQTTSMRNAGLYFLTAVELCNTGDSDITDLYYTRNVDPDQDVDWCGPYTTTNDIIYNFPGDDTSLVTAEGSSCGCFLGIGALDSRSRVSHGNFFISPATPEQAWNGTGGYSSSGSQFCDCAIQITFKIDIPAGTCDTIYFAHVLDPSDLQEALLATQTGGITQVTADGTDISPENNVYNTCQGDTVVLNITNGSGYEWTWFPDTYLNVDTGTTVISIPYDTVVYFVQGIGECDTIIDTITINAESVEGIANAGNDTIICIGDTINLQGSGGATYLWQPPVYLEDVNDPNTELQAPLTDMYYFLIAYNELGCPDTDVVYIDLLPEPDIDAGQDKVIILGGFTQLIADGGVSYEWTPAESLSNPLIYNPIASPDDTTVYYLTGYDEFGCVGYDSVTVFVQDPVYIVTPNAFTPNGDELNDFYIPVIIGPGTLLEFQIYNRWGEQVYEWNTTDRGWDGFFQGKEAEMGTYIVNALAKDDLTGKEIRQTGTVILMR